MKLLLGSSAAALDVHTRRRNAAEKFDVNSGFVQTLESPEIKMLRFLGLESPGKRHSPGIL